MGMKKLGTLVAVLLLSIAALSACTMAHSRPSCMAHKVGNHR